MIWSNSMIPRPLMIQGELKLEVWTLIIEKSTVIPPSLMVLFSSALVLNLEMLLLAKENIWTRNDKQIAYWSRTAWPESVRASTHLTPPNQKVVGGWGGAWTFHQSVFFCVMMSPHQITPIAVSSQSTPIWMKEKIVSERVRDNIFMTINCRWMESGAFYPPSTSLNCKIIKTYQSAQISRAQIRAGVQHYLHCNAFFQDRWLA